MSFALRRVLTFSLFVMYDLGCLRNRGVMFFYPIAISFFDEIPVCFRAKDPESLPRLLSFLGGVTP